MASLIFLGGLYPNQRCNWINNVKTDDYCTPWIAIIAIGNRIEGVEAKT